MTARTFRIDLTCWDRTTGYCNGTLDGGRVAYGPITWSEKTESRTTHAAVQFADGTAVVMNGNAWRAFEDGEVLDQFLELLALDHAAAQAAVESAERAATVFRTLVTAAGGRLSQTVYSDTADEEQVVSLARNAGRWEFDACNAGTDVFQAGAAALTKEIGIAEYVGDLLERARSADQQRREAQALKLVRSIAELPKWGEPDDAGEPFAPSDGLEDSHLVLMQLITEARSLHL